MAVVNAVAIMHVVDVMAMAAAVAVGVVKAVVAAVLDHMAVVQWLSQPS